MTEERKSEPRAISRRAFVAAVGVAAAVPVVGCGTSRLSSPTSPETEPPGARPEPTEVPSYARAAEPVLVATWMWGRTACERALGELARGGALIDAVEAGIREVELDPSVMTVGYGGLPNEAGVVQLDAMIMRGSTLDAGAVGALEGVATPISVARRVMERTRHVLLVGTGAAELARAEGFPTRDLLTPETRAAWQQWRATGDPGFRRARSPEHHDTVGVVGVDATGEAVVGVSTSGLAWKMPGRVGDSPLVGAGGYADSDVGAVCATGIGEEVIRVCGSHAVLERMRAGDDPTAAAEHVLRRMRRKRGAALGDAQVAFVAVRRDGAVGAAALRPGFTMAVARGSTVEMRAIAPLS